MDHNELPEAYVSAGREYRENLQRLGLDPQGVMWGQWDGSDEWNLLLVTNLLDRFGPLKINRLLFKAYNASVLPKEISPFAVELHSPQQALMRELLDAVAREKTQSLSGWGADGGDLHPNANKIRLKVGPLNIPFNGLYVLEARPVVRTEQFREWNRFRHQVDALAA